MKRTFSLSGIDHLWHGRNVIQHGWGFGLQGDGPDAQERFIDPVE